MCVSHLALHLSVGFHTAFAARIRPPKHASGSGKESATKRYREFGGE